ncbi:SPFH/Band 7/PHB domain protein [Candidatus Saccharimonas aalborgensis]|uniref:SPFH/Band 7/PHB domain protein n=1 Tax=Candidatus Saccharimonas aalborgensis TaxID=1332188 RepID=R4PLQ9_9BACT|nr:SPFH domain-containing protein [Candidatus Saccharimonas aalborgensis]AGL62578.1 SPFH/Band 7/PHB domain protein [Candidatus Saccharimonas aalborgensis]QQS68074.1 MAG: SPFH domain-containing protein [Candidatus Saccharibacteria bacterium]
MIETIVVALLLLAAIGTRIYARKNSDDASGIEDNYKKELADWRSRRDAAENRGLYFHELQPQRPDTSTQAITGKVTRYGSVALAGLAAIMLFFSTFVIVPTKDIGVVTTLGAPTSSMSNGPHFKAPWQDVTLMDGAIQTDTHNRPTGAAFNEGCIQVRIAHQIVACANMYVKWQAKETAVDGLFQNYRTFENIRDALVTKNLQSVLNAVFESYDPLSVDAETGQSNAPELSVLSGQALTKMRTAVGSQIDVSELAVTVMNYDDATQRKINDLQGQVAQTRIAQQAVKTAEQQAIANEKLAASVSKDPNVLVSKCLDHLADAIAKGYPLPAGFSCWPGGSSAVVVPSGTATK